MTTKKNIDYDFEKYHINILEYLSKNSYCSNFILTEQQFINATESKQNIIKPYVGFVINSKEFIDIRDHINDKLKKYKIVGVKTGTYGGIKGFVDGAQFGGSSWTDNYYYIMYINIHGEVYGNIFLEKRTEDEVKRRFNCQYRNIPNDWFLELFIKPFAIPPPRSHQKYTWDELHWGPFIDKNKYIGERYYEPTQKVYYDLYYEPQYKDYIVSNNIIPKDIMDDILNDKITLYYNFDCVYEDLYVICEGIWDEYPMDERTKKVILSYAKIYDYCEKNNLNKLYADLLYKNINFKEGHPVELDHPLITPQSINITLFYCSYLSSLNNTDVNGVPLEILNGEILNGKFLNIYDIYYKINKMRLEKIKLLEENIKISASNNKLLISNYYKQNLKLSEYIPIKTKKILQDGEIIEKKYTEINEINILDSDIKYIMLNSDYKKEFIDYNNIKIIRLYNCLKFKKIRGVPITKLYIDDNEIEIFHTEHNNIRNRRNRRNRDERYARNRENRKNSDANIKIDDKHKIIKVEYNEPNIRCNGENKSKLLKPNSELYNHLMKLKEILKQNGFNHQDRMGLHTEILNDNTETIDDFIKRVNILEGREIDIKNPDIYDIIGRAIVLLLGDLEGYNKDAKITIAFIDNDKIQDAMKCLLSNI